MPILDWIRSISSSTAADHGDTESVRRIVRELDKLEPARARWLAAFAFVLSRAAGADLHISDVETTKMVDLVQRTGGLSESQATLVVEIAKNQHRLFGGTENFLVTREFREIATDSQRRELLECVFAVSAADEGISNEEDAQTWQIAKELGFSHPEYVQVRLAYSDQLSIFKHRDG